MEIFYDYLLFLKLYVLNDMCAIVNCIGRLSLLDMNWIVGTKLSIISSPEPLGSQGEFIVYPSSRRPSVRPSSVVVNNFKHLLLRNRWADQSQILCGASLGRGNDILFAASGSHDQDGRHAHIW